MAGQDKILFRGRIITLALEQVTLPNGSHAELEIVRHPGGAAVVALDTKHRVCLLRQYRHAAADWLWELPAGKLDPGEPPLHTAQRELQEEAGLTAGTWDTLGTLIASPGILTEVVHLYLARDLTPVPATPEEHEVFELHWLPFHEALERAIHGDITDAKTVIGLSRAAVRLEPISKRGIVR